MAVPSLSATFPVVVIGTSAGGVQALLELVRALPADFPAAICIVQHIPAYAVSYLPDLLTNAGALPARHPQNGELLRPGVIYVAPPDYHLLLEADHVLVSRGPKENNFRPSVDALFRSAAYTHGPRVIGIVLTGYLNDGTSGLWTVQRLGGVAVVQDPKDAYANAMPQSALEYITPDHLVPLAELAPLLGRLLAQPRPPAAGISPEELARIKVEVDVAKGENAHELHLFQYGELTPFVCPLCQGPLMRLVEEKLVRFRCRTGHGFTLSFLLDSVTESVEYHLYAAMQSLQETQELLHQLGQHFAQQAQPALAATLGDQAEQARLRAQAVHESIVQHEALTGTQPTPTS